jgi:hypothetical protein
MFIDANKIIDLISVAKECQEKLPEEEQWIHFKDIEATLQKLIDDEACHLEELAAKFKFAEAERVVRACEDVSDEELLKLLMPPGWMDGSLGELCGFGDSRSDPEAPSKEELEDWPHGI